MRTILVAMGLHSLVNGLFSLGLTILARYGIVATHGPTAEVLLFAAGVCWILSLAGAVEALQPVQSEPLPDEWEALLHRASKRGPFQ